MSWHDNNENVGNNKSLPIGDQWDEHTVKH